MFSQNFLDISHYLYDLFWTQSHGVGIGLVALLLLLTVLVLRKMYNNRSRLEEVKTKDVPVKPRFRKRDKVMYYGRRLIRKSQNVLTRRPRKQEILRLARRLLRGKREQKTLQPKEPPAALLEADLGGGGLPGEHELGLPTEFVYMLRNVRVFGHLDKPMYMEICKHIEVLFVKTGQTLFQIGDPDDSIYVVQEGQMDVFIKEDADTETLVKEVLPGDSIHSLLSILDVLTGHAAPYKTVMARARRDSTILKLPASSFQRAFSRFPESMVRIVQVIMVRLIRVTFMALHNYLGLDQQLMKPKLPPGDAEANLSVHSLKRQPSLDGVSAGGSSGRSPDELRARDASLLDVCLQDLAKLLGLDEAQDVGLLLNKVNLRHYKTGHVLCKQGDPDSSLYFIVFGSVLVSQKVIGQEEKETTLFVAGPGELTGILAVLSGEPSIFSMRTHIESTLASISKADFYSIMQSRPHVVLSTAHFFIKRLSGFVRQIDFALDWTQIDAGRALYREGDHCEYIYIILNGRLRTIATTKSGKKEVTAEFGRGELVGIVEVLTETDRQQTAMAVRDTELAKVPKDLLDFIKRKYPQVVTRLIHLLGHRLLGTAARLKESTAAAHILMDNPSVDPRSPIGLSPTSNLSTVAIVPASDNVPLTTFTLELQHALSLIGPSLRLTSDIITKRLGTWALDSVNDYRLSSWLATQEDIHRIVLYQCDYRFTPWTQRCVRQSDILLIVALADEAPTVGKLEKALEGMAVRSQKELVLLHKPGPADASLDLPKRPSNTVDWLNARDWCLLHHHLRCPARIFTIKPPDRIMALYETVMRTRPDVNADFSRLARFITGTAIGVVLGGGGARGASQIGLLKAMSEAGIPIDMVGGTSIGSFVGALWSDERNAVRVRQRARTWFVEMTSMWKKLLDLTYPITSMMTGASFNRAIESTFGDVQIEDLWLPYFCITTDITASKMRVHTSGSLWRYVRSSMTLSGYLPPLCDPKDGHLLLDGGYVNNLPADVMKAMGAHVVFAVDVGAHEDRNYTNYGDQLSGWWLLWKRWNPWASPIRVPGMEEIQSHLAYISCERNMEQIKMSAYCDYVRPPIDKYQTLQFGSFDEIHEVGYNYAKPYFNGLVKSDKFNYLFADSQPNVIGKSKSLGPDAAAAFAHSNSSFTDLAELISQIKNPRSSFNIKDAIDEVLDDEGDDDDEDDDDDDEEDDGITEVARRGSSMF